MTDRELLEAAARAAGRETPMMSDVKRGLSWGNGWWNPLTDDGDALRLACALHMCVAINRASSHNQVAGTTALFYWAPDAWAWEPHEQDIGAATRRAIVRAAAAMAPTDRPT